MSGWTTWSPTTTNSARNVIDRLPDVLQLDRKGPVVLPAKDSRSRSRPVTAGT